MLDTGEIRFHPDGASFKMTASGNNHEVLTQELLDELYKEHNEGLQLIQAAIGEAFARTRSPSVRESCLKIYRIADALLEVTGA